MVGTELARKLREGGHNVKIGSRTSGDDKVTFAEAAKFGDVVLNCTSGTVSLHALEMAAVRMVCRRDCRCATTIRWANKFNVRCLTPRS